ncbi:OSJNBa0059H15.7 protein, related [Eimeria necatrix]|uniref:OSJNBa0059H15.7 protein, related n=1 Tax=Eimeria necatrix TaxID=51315 RepID=U6MQM9_9EIME|nr:OSJNBa0059H15.7 protein, related [Eimeria necatrix]CDJ64774.1 OSJNBa0059H15.7 protein, related [Eimeria necatrix]
MSSSYRPQSGGQTERVNRTLEQMLRTYIKPDEREWERLLPALELAYNTTSHSSTELSPFEVMIGENPLTAADLDIVGALAPTLTPPMTKPFRRLCDRAQSHILKTKWQQKYYADTKR